MKKVKLLKSYLGFPPGVIFKTTGEKARDLINAGMAEDPEGELTAPVLSPKEASEEMDVIENASLDPGERAVRPRVGRPRGRRPKDG